MQELTLLEQSMGDKFNGKAMGIAAFLPIKNGLQLVILLKKWDLLPSTINATHLEQMIYNYSKTLDIINNHKISPIKTRIQLVRTPMPFFDSLDSDRFLKEISNEVVVVKNLDSGHFGMLRESVPELVKLLNVE
jgi:hypothetical protein